MPIKLEDITVFNVKELSELIGISQMTIREYIKQCEGNKMDTRCPLNLTLSN